MTRFKLDKFDLLGLAAGIVFGVYFMVVGAVVTRDPRVVVLIFGLLIVGSVLGVCVGRVVRRILFRREL